MSRVSCLALPLTHLLGPVRHMLAVYGVYCCPSLSSSSTGFWSISGMPGKQFKHISASPFTPKVQAEFISCPSASKEACCWGPAWLCCPSLLQQLCPRRQRTLRSSFYLYFPFITKLLAQETHVPVELALGALEGPVLRAHATVHIQASKVIVSPRCSPALEHLLLSSCLSTNHTAQGWRGSFQSGLLALPPS
jgi:hypothetical protein